MPIVDLDALPVVAASLLHRSPPGADAAPCTGGWYLHERGAPTLTVLDPDGITRDTLAMPVHSAGNLRLAVDPVARRIAVAGVATATISGPDGSLVHVSHPSWSRFPGGAVSFDVGPGSPDRLWLVVPGEAPRGLMPQPASGTLLLVDCTSGTVLDAVGLGDEHPEGYSMLAAPGHGVVVNGGYGQVGSMTWCARNDGDRIDLRPLGWTGVAAAFDAERSEILFMPHDDDDIEVRMWGGDVVAQLAGADLFGTWEEQEERMEQGEEPDGFGYVGAFLDAERLVVLTHEERVLVLDRATGAALGLLRVDGEEPDATTVALVAAGRLVVVGRAASLVAVADGDDG